MAASLKDTSWIVCCFLFLQFYGVLCIHVVRDHDAAKHQFNEFILKYKKAYTVGTREYDKRFQNFKESLERHHILNKKKLLNDTYSAIYGVNQFSDLSPAEFKALYLSDNIPSKVHSTERLFQSHHYGSNKFRLLPSNGGQQVSRVPLKVDWRTKNAVSPVGNQKSCGGCWAFSTVETIESAYAIKTNSSPPLLSVQQVIDCAVNGNYGCKGGSICGAMKWLNDTSLKLVTADRYPLTDTSNYCKMEPPGKVGILDFACNKYLGFNEFYLLEALTHGPVAAAVDATTWNDYLGGIIKYHCSRNNNHAIQIVGYDLSGPVPYYIIRNSWGTTFGNDGYIYVKYGDNLCGIGLQVGIPVV